MLNINDDIPTTQSIVVSLSAIKNIDITRENMLLQKYKMTARFLFIFLNSLLLKKSLIVLCFSE